MNNKDYIAGQFRELRRNTEIIIADSSEQTITQSNQLLRGLFRVLQINIISYLDKSKIVIDNISKWMAIKLKKNEKIIGLISLYQIL